jgi:DNA-directed RNA polymerase subunit alpha
MNQLVARNWRDLIRPKSVPVDEDSLTDYYGKFVAEPLERGFGLTLGNSLRRVLLSSLQGAAISAVKIDGALHEFTSVPDVVEDVTEIVLNLKEVVVRSHSTKSITVRIDKEGPCDVTARDIQTTDQVEILNPEHKICTVAKGGRFAAELTINVRRSAPSPSTRSSRRSAR